MSKKKRKKLKLSKDIIKRGKNYKHKEVRYLADPDIKAKNIDDYVTMSEDMQHQGTSVSKSKDLLDKYIEATDKYEEDVRYNLGDMDFEAGEILKNLIELGLIQIEKEDAEDPVIQELLQELEDEGREPNGLADMEYLKEIGVIK